MRAPDACTRRTMEHRSFRRLSQMEEERPISKSRQASDRARNKEDWERSHAIAHTWACDAAPRGVLETAKKADSRSRASKPRRSRGWRDRLAFGSADSARCTVTHL